MKHHPGPYAIFPWILDAPSDMISPIVGCQSCHQSLGLFGGLHDADVAEIRGVDTRVVRRDQAQAKARFRKWLSS